ncbi:MAG: hypothetical protein F4Y57_06490, partial [Acidobacteria bacterium]|nr:hypothetical protein [Acidobacteriota bacterium]
MPPSLHPGRQSPMTCVRGAGRATLAISAPAVGSHLHWPPRCLLPKGTPMPTAHVRHPGVLLVACGMSLLVPERVAAQPGESVVIGKNVELFSEILDENRPLIIGTPRRYETSEERYPVVYLLDGDAHFHHTTGTGDYLARTGRMPEVITVAIPNTDRGRDLTPPSAQEFDREHFPT